MTKQIDHDPHEPKLDRSGMRWIWLPLWAFIAYLWFDQWRAGDIAWDQIMLGIGTGGVLTAWAIDITGDKVPDSWRRKRQ